MILLMIMVILIYLIGKFLLKKGWNDLVISLNDIENSPKDRLLNLAEVENVRFFVKEQMRERVVYVDSVYLGK